MLAACGKNNAEAASDTTAAATAIGAENVMVVPLDTLRTGPAVSGTLAADKAATIRALLPGSIVRTFAEQGQRVAAGQQLAQIDDAGIRDAFLSARSGLTSAQNNAEVAARELQRAQTLHEAGAIAQRDLDNVRRGNVAAQAGLEDARARVAGAQEQLSRTRVVAPFTGIVSERQANAGDVVNPGTPLFTVVEPSTMRLEASVPADQLGAVRIGAPVTFTVTGYPGRSFTGRVTRINPVADPATRQVRIYVSLPNAGSTLVAGLFAEGRVASETHSAAVIPMSAVDERGLRPSVMRLKNGKVEKVDVTLGLRDESSERIEVRAGLVAGDTLLLGAARGITPGTAVRVSVVSDKRR
jgi:RND family efflux transporter MFP subunit